MSIRLRSSLCSLGLVVLSLTFFLAARDACLSTRAGGIFASKARIVAGSAGAAPSDALAAGGMTFRAGRLLQLVSSYALGSEPSPDGRSLTVTGALVVSGAAGSRIAFAVQSGSEKGVWCGLVVDVVAARHAFTWGEPRDENRIEREKNVEERLEVPTPVGPLGRS